MGLKETKGNEIERVARLIGGLKNNSSAVVDEWGSGAGAATIKRLFREKFGRDGDVLRHAGYGVIQLGAETEGAIDRFALKLGHALFFKHVGRRLVGTVCYQLVEALKTNENTITTLLSIAPESAIIRRGSKDLRSRFDYRFNHSATHGVIWIVAYFGGQFVMSLIAGEEDFLVKMRELDSSFLASFNGKDLCSTYFAKNESEIVNLPSSSDASTA